MRDLINLKVAVVRAVLASIFLAMALVSQAGAVQVTPVLIDLETAGSASQSQISVMNDGQSEIAVELEVFERTYGSTGEESRVSADDRFLIFPLQARIQPGRQQVFRLQWVGDPVNVTNAFAVSVKQVPVQLPNAFTGVQFLFNFNVLVWVSPPNATPDLVIVGAKGDQTSDGKPAVGLTVRNQGSKYGRISQAGLKLSSQGGASVLAELSPEQIRERLGDTVVMPGKERYFVLPVDAPVGGGAIDAQIIQ